VPTSLGAPLATLPRFQHAVGEIEALLVAGDELLRAHARRIDAGEDLEATAAATPLVKTIVTGNAIRAVELAVGLVGNAGLSRRNPLERHYRDVLCGRIHTPQDDVVLTTTGSAALAAARASEDQP